MIMKILFFLSLFSAAVKLSAQDTTRLSLLFVGDIMQHDSQIADALDKRTGEYDYRPCFQYIKPFIRAADLAIGNLEVTLAGRPYKGYPQFSAPDELLTALKDAGFDAIVTANNHSADRGKAGIERTIAMLDSFDVPHTGTFRSQAEKNRNHPLIIERQGFRLALLNYTYGTNGLPVPRPNIVNMLDTVEIRKDLIRAAGMNPDAIIVFTHWGAEYQSLPSKNQKAITALCFEYGARLVIGSHPHVVQPMEWQKSKDQLVAYSLGNFVSGQRKRYTDGGAMIRIELRKVTFNDGSSVTGIDTAGYMLEWVFRTNDANMDYYVIPVTGKEKATFKDNAANEAYDIFASDSRALFRKHNVNVPETGSPLLYYVGFTASDTLAVKDYLKDNSGVTELQDGGFPRLGIGPFTYLDAQHLYRKIKRDLPVDSLLIERRDDCCR
jgi:poly-gamma-glutamate capsule biosynthesis protein CapA/YwtB (metallophosphatase superfamily)